jgi:DNA-binding PadR family transcriptional regulator
MTSINAAWDPRFTALRGAMRHRGRMTAFAQRGPGDDDALGGPGFERPRGPARPGRRRGPRGFDGPGFGPDFPPGFGPEFGPGPRGRGRRGGRRSRGDIRLAVLALLAEQPRHGYEIIQEINERTQGSWRPSPGSVYPTLQQLADEGLVLIEDSDGRRTVALTEAGTSYVEEHRDELAKVWEAVVGDEVSTAVANLRTQYSQLHAAVAQIMSAGTDEQRETAATALADARKAIYRLLAED